MGKDIYSILNHANINLEDYEKENFNDIEKKKAKANFRKAISKKKSHKRNIMAAGVILALTVTLFGTNARVRALTREFTIAGVENISSFLGIKKDLDEYKTVLNKTITDNGITIQLNEVLLDGNQITVSCNIISDGKILNEGDAHTFGTIYINGKKASKGSGGGSKKIDDYTVQEVLTYDLDNVKAYGDLNVKLACSEVLINGGTRKGTWTFEFKANGDELRADTKEIELNNKFILENGEEYTLKKYVENSFSQKIYASISGFKRDSMDDITLKGTDDLGNKVVFGVRSVSEDGALFEIENIFGNLNENAKTLTLTPYCVKLPKGGGEIAYNDYKKVGDQFTIDLTKLK